VTDSGRLCHILVADDEPHIGRIIKMKLEQGPFRVSLAYDGQEALDFINSGEQLDLVLLDLMMPKLSGLDVLRWSLVQRSFSPNLSARKNSTRSSRVSLERLTKRE